MRPNKEKAEAFAYMETLLLRAKSDAVQAKQQNVLKVYMNEQNPGHYEVIKVDQKGSATRVGGVVATDTWGGGLLLPDIIHGMQNGVKLLEKEGFSGLIQEARKLAEPLMPKFL